MIEDKFLPDGFRAKISSEIGEKYAEILLSALCGEPETSVRTNRYKPTYKPFYPDMTPIEWCKSGSYLEKRPSFTSNPLLHAGAFYVQDASSMVYETIVEKIAEWRAENGEQRKERLRVCDLCAAPGGKTTAILNALPEGSVMLANEFNPTRANILKENLCKYGYPHIITTNADTDRLSDMKGGFDLIAIDAPCSGEGMMRKDEMARAQWSEGLIRQCSTLQREILSNGIEMLAPGGYLIYSTCTFNTMEDEDNAAWIAETFGLEPVDTHLSGNFGIQSQVKGEIPCLRFMPGFTRGEGLFVTVFRRPISDIGISSCLKLRKKGKKEIKGKERIDRQITETAKSWIEGDFEIINHDGHLLALSAATVELLDSIPKGVRVISAGVEIGEIKGNDLIPSHKLAMSTAFGHTFPEVELSRENALLYLSKEAILLPEGTPKGYVTVTFEGIPLGFLKNLGNRSNNLYPSEYRIRHKRLIINDQRLINNSQ
ncbi:MAG: RsmB/NOP family class I SAM-dependent RNA methyltransferase [Muribaculaceae bacterium]|nr:RsmB/NOP family class I SAM-dependent RNA methyltransferase [Muribaculaceae bacterium]